MPILDPLAPELAAHKLRTGRDGLIFGRCTDLPFVPSTIRFRAIKAWEMENKRRIEQAENPATVELLAPITLHEARHTCASLLIASGANAKVVQPVMGHATIGITFDTYGHLMPGGLDEAAAAANIYLAQQSGQGPVLTAVG